MTARLSEESWDGWNSVARDLGVTVSALMEAIGQQLPALPLSAALVELAKDIDVERRRRR